MTANVAIINQSINQSVNQLLTFAKAPVTGDHWRRTSNRTTSIPAPELESLAACRSSWHSTCHDAVVSFEARQTEARQLQ